MNRPIVIRSSFTRGALGALVGCLAIVIVFVVGWLAGLGSGLAAMANDSLVEQITLREGQSGRIVILPVEGGIDDPMARFVAECCRELIERGDADAVVLRVDSGGGGVSPSDRIWKCVEDLKASGLPIVASFGGTAASGGYYISCAADDIVAEPTCVTGSIGVIAQILTLQGLADKVGITPTTIVATNSPDKDVANDIFRSWGVRDRDVVLGILNSAYDTFTERVAAGRKTKFNSIDEVRQVATGAVFTADDALDVGLIDQIGYLEDAIASAESLAGLTPGSSTVVRLGRPKSIFDAPFGATAPGFGISSAADLRDLATELAQPRIMYQLAW